MNVETFKIDIEVAMSFLTCKVNYLKSIGVHGIGDMNALKLIIEFGMLCFYLCACNIIWDYGCHG